MSDSYLHGVEVLEITSGARTIRAVSSSTIGVVGTAPYADAARFPLDTPVLVANAAEAKALLATFPAEPTGAEVKGSLPAALNDIFEQASPPILVVRVAPGANEAATLAEVAGDAVTSQGVYALLAAQGLTKVTPRILIATGWTHQVPKAGDPAADAANPVAAALKAVAAKLRAVAVIDGPNDTYAAAVAKHGREGGERVYMVDGHARALVDGAIANRPASAKVAGLIAATDAARGFWWSPSNQEINGVLGLARPIEFSLSDPAAETNRLNQVGIGTIVSLDGGYRLWGNRTTEDGFLSVRRTADMIHEAVERSFRWALDRPLSSQLLNDMVDLVQDYLRELKARGAILGGTAWLDPELNTEASLRAGRAYVNFDFLPPPPLDRLTFSAATNDVYFAELVTLTTGQAA